MLKEIIVTFYKRNNFYYTNAKKSEISVESNYDQEERKYCIYETLIFL